MKHLEKKEQLCKSSRQCLSQEVVTYILTTEAFATRIKNLDRRKLSLIAWSFPSGALDCLILKGFKGQKHCHASLVSDKMCWLVGISCSEFLKVKCCLLDSTLILVANASTGNMLLPLVVPYHIKLDKSWDPLVLLNWIQALYNSTCIGLCMPNSGLTLPLFLKL